MSQRRPLCPTERMVDVFDRASTLNFTVVAKLRGSLSQQALRQALRALELRHPLLRARLERDGKGGVQFVPGEAREIPLHVEDVPEAAWCEHAERSLAHRVWEDAGPRAELTLLRHGGQRSTLLLCMHHLCSDASSGIIALRDLLELLDSPSSAAQVPSPGQRVLLPKDHGNLRWQARAALGIARSLLGNKPLRFPPVREASERPRRLRRLSLPPEALTELAARAKRDGATVHGVLCAALARAVASHVQGAPRGQRILHPVDLRRLLDTGHTVRDAVGYYVSSLDTQHVVQTSTPLGSLAREITLAVRAGKAQGAPLLSAPIQGPWLTRSVRRTGDLPRFRDYLEQKVMFNTFSLTNLGPLEPLRVRAQVGALQLDDLFYVAAGSVLSMLGASASSLGGQLSFTLGWVEPMVSGQLGGALFEQVAHELYGYAGASQPASSAA